MLESLGKDEHASLKHLLRDRHAMCDLNFGKQRALKAASLDKALEKDLEQFGEALKRLAASASEAGADGWGDIADEDIPVLTSDHAAQWSSSSVRH